MFLWVPNDHNCLLMMIKSRDDKSAAKIALIPLRLGTGWNLFILCLLFIESLIRPWPNFNITGLHLNFVAPRFCFQSLAWFCLKWKEKLNTK